jgi:hypothetical protein
MSNNEDDDYEVGYGKPPKHSQFKKGQSGNPKGRPKGTKNLLTDFEEELAERVNLRENGKTKSVTKQRAMAKSVLANAMTGDTRAADFVFKVLEKQLFNDTDGDQSEPLSLADEAIIEAFLSQLKGSENDEDEPG